MKTPVALFLYRRPEQTARVFAAIRAAKPPVLFLLADGPKPGEEAVCQAAREAVTKIDWPCSVSCIFTHENRGSKVTQSEGISHVFDLVDRCIFLEDDCLPDPTFFPYCEELLTQYADEPRVMAISGDNFQPDEFHAPDTYHFSRYPHMWGWATWRRAWAHYDAAPSSLTLRSPNPLAAAHWRNILNHVNAGNIDAYDYQFMFAMWKHDGLCVTPHVNLIHNIGFGEGATNMTHAGVHPNPPSAPITFPLQHPSVVVPHAAADAWEMDNLYFAPHVRRDLARRLFIMESN